MTDQEKSAPPPASSTDGKEIKLSARSRTEEDIWVEEFIARLEGAVRALEP